MGNAVTPSRNIRVADALWNAAKDGAAAEETTVSAVINQFLLEAYGHGIKHYIITRGTGRFCSYCDLPEAEIRAKSGPPEDAVCDWYLQVGEEQ